MAVSAQRFLVSGTVQGVGFRWWVQAAAQRLGLVGFVRNLADGRVEVVAEGGIDRLVELGRELRTGPDLARVEVVHEEERPPSRERRTFDILHGDKVIG